MKQLLVRFVSLVTAVFAAFALIAAPVSAKTEHFSFTYDETTTESPCGFDLQRHDVGKGNGISGNGKFNVTNAGVATITNLATGLSLTEKYHLLFKNFNFVDNGDGSQSSDQTILGSWRMFNSSGKLLLRDHGPITYHITLIPTDEGPVFLSQEITFEHGTHHDTETYCKKLIAAIGAG